MQKTCPELFQGLILKESLCAYFPLFLSLVKKLFEIHTTLSIKNVNNLIICIFIWMGKISWTDHVTKEEVLLRVKEQRNILHEISKRKVNWIGHILRRNCLLKQVIEGKMKGGI